MLRWPSGAIGVLPSAIATASLYDIGTTTPINEPIYADATSMSTLTNPVRVDTHGGLEFWLGLERELDVVIDCPGYTSVRSTVTAESGGLITTEMVAPGAVQEQIGAFTELVSYTLTQTDVWTETPIQITAAVEAGVRLRLEFAVLLASPTKGQHVFWAIMVDGVGPTQGALGGIDTPENHFGSMAVGTYYFTPATSAAHRFAFGLYGPSGTEIFNLIASTLYITAQKR